jgi:hypothetical protein
MRLDGRVHLLDAYIYKHPILNAFRIQHLRMLPQLAKSLLETFRRSSTLPLG